MATHATTPADEKASTIPGSYFGTDGEGFDHYYRLSGDEVHVTDGDDVRAVTLGDRDLVDYAIDVIDEHGDYWTEVRLDPPKCDWLTGDLPVGEVAADE